MIAVTKKDRLWIIGLDPGVSTGLFGVRVDGSDVNTFARFQGEYTQALAALEGIVRGVAVWHEHVLIAGERFTTSARTGKLSAQPIPQRVLGAAEQLTYQYTNVEFTLQTPADAKKLADNWTLRDLGFYTRGEDVGTRDSNDVNDAARHMLLALMRRRATAFDALLKAADERRSESQR